MPHAGSHALMSHTLFYNHWLNRLLATGPWPNKVTKLIRGSEGDIPNRVTAMRAAEETRPVRSRLGGGTILGSHDVEFSR